MFWTERIAPEEGSVGNYTEAPYKKKKVLNMDELLHNDETRALFLEDLEWNQDWTECMDFWSSSTWNVTSKEDLE